MRSSPIFSLYGESASNTIEDGMHFESIAERSQLYDWEISAHRHANLLQIVYLSRGGGIAFLEQERRIMHAPSLTIVPAGIEHGFSFQREVQGTVLSFSNRRLQDLLGQDDELAQMFANTSHGIVPNHQGEADRLGAQVDALRAEFNQARPWRARLLQAMAQSVLIAVARLLKEQDQQRAPLSRSHLHARAFQALVDRHYIERRPLSFYAQALGITTTQLNRVCQAATERTALEVVQERQMTQACRELAFSVLSIKQIAFALGFQDESYFTRVFRRRMHCTPLNYRLSVQASMRSSRLST